MYLGYLSRNYCFTIFKVENNAVSLCTASAQPIFMMIYVSYHTPLTSSLKEQKQMLRLISKLFLCYPYHKCAFQRSWGKGGEIKGCSYPSDGIPDCRVVVFLNLESCPSRACQRRGLPTLFQVPIIIFFVTSDCQLLRCIIRNKKPDR